MCRSLRVSVGSEKSWFGLDVSNSILSFVMHAGSSSGCDLHILLGAVRGNILTNCTFVDTIFLRKDFLFKNKMNKSEYVNYFTRKTFQKAFLFFFFFFLRTNRNVYPCTKKNTTKN